MTTPPEYPVAGVLAVTEDGSALLRAHFLALIERLLPLGYVYPMKLVPNAGYELFQAASVMGERVAQAVHRLEMDGVLFFARGGSQATGTVWFTRPTAAAGAVTILRGSTVVGRQGRRFATTADLVFGGGVLGPLSVGVQAVAPGYEYNVRGESTGAGGDLLPGDIATTGDLFESPPYGDATFTVKNLLATSGGVEAALDGRGAERGLVRAPGESDTSFRFRIRSLADTVSPNAVARALTALLGTDNFCLREVGTAKLRGAYFDGNTAVGAAASTRDYYDQDGFLLEGDTSSTGFEFQEPVEVRSPSNTLLAQGYYGNVTVTGATSRRSLARRGVNRLPYGTVTAGTRLLGMRTGTSWLFDAVIDTSASYNPRRHRTAFDYLEFRGFFLVGVPAGSAGEFGMAYGAYPYAAYGALGSWLNFYGGYPRSTALVRLAAWHRLDAVRAGGVGFGLYVERIGCS